MKDDARIDPMVVVDGIIVEYRDGVDGFSRTKGVDHDVTLASRLFRDEGGWELTWFRLFRLLEDLSCMRGILMFTCCS
jgi:hypothetical protein